jgi:hypothetical protein
VHVKWSAEEEEDDGSIEREKTDTREREKRTTHHLNRRNTVFFRIELGVTHTKQQN